MKILINFLQSQSGGARSYLRNILPYISEWTDQENVKVYVLIYKKQIDIDKIETTQLNINFIVIDKIPKLKPFSEQIIVRKTIKQICADILFTPYQMSFPPKGVKSISMIRNMEPFYHWEYPGTIRNRIRNIVLQLISNYTLKNSDSIVAVSDFAKDYLINKLAIPASKITRIYHGRDQLFSPIQSANDTALLNEIGVGEKAFIFTSGAILPYRKLETILAAFASSDFANDYKLVVAGDSNDVNYKALINKSIIDYDLENKVIRLGFVEIEKIRVLYRHCKVYVTATEIEACPNIAIEAMSSGCHIISSDKDPMPEMFIDKAMYFKAGSAQDLTEKFNEFLSKPQITDSIDYDIDRFSWQQCANNTLGAIKSTF